MAGSTLTDDFWANDILWQLSVFAYNISVMTCLPDRQVRQKKSKFKKQEHFILLNLNLFYEITDLTGQAFIDWFITVPAKITSSGHQIELRMYSLIHRETPFLQSRLGRACLPSGRLDRLIEAA